MQTISALPKKERIRLGARFQDGSPEQLFHALHRKRSIAVDTLLSARGLGHIGQPIVLMILSQQANGTISSQKELAERLRVSPATMTVSLKTMERDGYIKKLSNASDLRCKPIAITEKGRCAADQISDVFELLDNGLYEGFSPEEKQTISGYYRRMLSNLDDITSGTRKSQE